eukprot:m.59068 g.59068  ORF g.59068 m.59068 type:complete len:63 (-) comp11745_c0_seq2:2957-3145(-)
MLTQTNQRNETTGQVSNLTSVEKEPGKMVPLFQQAQISNIAKEHEARLTKVAYQTTSYTEKW